MSYFFNVLKKDLIVAFRQRTALLNPLFFYVLVTLLFPLAITSDPQKLRILGPGVLWITLLFANMLAIDHLFSEDFEDGTLEQILISHNSINSFVMAKLLGHWLMTSLPLLIITVVLANLFFLEYQVVLILIAGLLIGSLIFTIIGGIGAGLTLSLKQRGLLLILLILPLYLPVLIFGAGAVNDANQHLPVASQLIFLAAFLSLAITFGPYAIAASLKISVD